MDDEPLWERLAAQTEHQIEQALRGAGSDGLTVAQLRELIPRKGEEFDAGLRRFRAGSLCIETRERRPDKAGHMREQVVLRHRLPDENGKEPASVSRDPAIREKLKAIELNQKLQEAIAEAKGRGLTRPETIARHIIANPLSLLWLRELLAPELEEALVRRVEAIGEE